MTETDCIEIMVIIEDGRESTLTGTERTEFEELLPLTKKKIKRHSEVARDEEVVSLNENECNSLVNSFIFYFKDRIFYTFLKIRISTISPTKGYLNCFKDIIRYCRRQYSILERARKLALFTFLVNSAISNGYCISDACCGVPGLILYLEVECMERRFYILTPDHFQKLVGRIVKQVIPS